MNECPCCGAPVRKCKKCGDVEYDPQEPSFRHIRYVPWAPPYYPYIPSIPSVWINDGNQTTTVAHTKTCSEGANNG